MELCTNKREKMKGNVEVGRNVSALMQPTMPKKCSDLGTFSIPCTKCKCNFDAMLDLDTSINVIPSSICRSLRLGALEPIGIVTQLANRSIAHPLGILDDMVMQVSDMISPIDFYVLDMKDELSSKGCKLILGRPFLKTTKTKIVVHAGTLSMEFGHNRVEYNIFVVMKHPTQNHLVFYLDVIDQLGDYYINLHSEFPDFDDFTDYDCTCTRLTECPICLQISSVINASARVVDIIESVAVQSPLLSIVQPLQPPVIIANKPQTEQKEWLLQELKKLGDFYEHLVKHSNL
ncbi:hypothetical protein CR513_07220, partial [Mucuna pruriens]